MRNARLRESSRSHPARLAKDRQADECLHYSNNAILYLVYPVVAGAATVETAEKTVEKAGVVIADHFCNIHYGNVSGLQEMGGFCHAFILKEFFEGVACVFLNKTANGVIVSAVSLAEL